MTHTKTKAKATKAKATKAKATKAKATKAKATKAKAKATKAKAKSTKAKSTKAKSTKAKAKSTKAKATKAKATKTNKPMKVMRRDDPKLGLVPRKGKYHEVCAAALKLHASEALKVPIAIPHDVKKSDENRFRSTYRARVYAALYYNWRKAFGDKEFPFLFRISEDSCLVIIRI